MLAAVSGGADSTALLLALHRLGLRLTAAHYDHALRPRSAADRVHVQRLCDELGVPLVGARRRAELERGSPEAAARRLRYAFLERARRRVGADLIAVGHTADDVAEGVVLHLLRGSGLAGARGMPARQGLVVRPLLGARREELRAALRAAGVDWLEDPSNADPRLARARVRHELLPRLELARPGLTERLIGAARGAAEQYRRLAEAAEPLHSGARADLAALVAAPAVVRAEVWRRLYAAAGGPEPGLGRVHLQAMDALAAAGRTGASLDLPRGLRFRVSASAAEVVSAMEPPRPPPVLVARQCGGCARPGAVHLPAETVVSVRRRTPGLRLRGRGGSRKLQDVLVDARVPRWGRDELPLVFAGERLVWVPGVALDQDVCLPTSRPGLHLEFKPAGSRTG